MNLWQRFAICNMEDSDVNRGFAMHFEKDIDCELRRLYLSFSKWLRQEYYFPVHFNIYIKNSEKIRLLSGKMAYGSFRYFENKDPYISIPSKIEKELLKKFSLEDIYDSILSSLVHELTHYFQWVLDLEQTDSVSERQANYYRYRIIDKYYEYMQNKK